MNKQVFNERLKIRANFYNTVAAAFSTTGVVAPLITVIYGLNTKPVDPALVFTGSAICLLASLALHLQADSVLGGIKE